MSEFADEDVNAPAEARDRSGPSGPRHGRRLSDKILVAFHHACDAHDLIVAEQLLKTLESMLTRRGVPPEHNRRRALESLVAAHERLWYLRHADSKEL